MTAKPLSPQQCGRWPAVSFFANELSKDNQMTKEEVKQVMDEVEGLDLPDGAHWALVHERLSMQYGEVFDIIAADLAFFGAEPL